MPSIQAKLVNRCIRLVMKPKRLHEIETPILRDWVEKRVIALYPSGVSRTPIEAPVRGEWQRPDTLRTPATLLYLHGGGYVFGSVRTHRALTMGVAAKAGCEVFSLEYRLAPEHPCPAAIEDALAAYDFLLASGRNPRRILVAGDSAGGGLALALMQALRDLKKPMLAGAVLYSPWTDLTASGETMTTNADSDAMFQRDSVVGGALYYAKALGLSDPRVSPLFGDFHGLAPLLVFASRSEMLFDDSTRLVEKALKAGIGVRFEPRDDLVHVWPLFHPLTPEAAEAVAISADFIAERTERSAS